MEIFHTAEISTLQKIGIVKAESKQKSDVYIKMQYVYGTDSSVSIATGYGLDGSGIESRWGARFSAPVQTGPGAHPVSCTMGTGYRG